MKLLLAALAAITLGLASSAAVAQCAGDLAASPAGCTVIGIQKMAVSPQVPTSGQRLAYSAAAQQWGATTDVKVAAFSWGPGTDLATAAVPFQNFPQNATITAIICTPEVAVGATATFDVYISPSATALGAGGSTKVNTTSCNANGTAATDQSLGVASAAITAGNRIGIVATGTGWASSAGSGVLTVVYQ